MRLQNRRGRKKEGMLCVSLITVLTFLSLDYVSPRHPYQLPSDPSLMVLLNRTFSNKTSKKKEKKHISQVQGGQTLTYVLYIRTG